MKNNSGFRLLLKVWVAVASTIAFIIGWVVFGHTGKPVSANAQFGGGQSQGPAQGQLAPLPTLPPLAPLDSSSLSNGSSSGFQPLPQSQPSFNFAQPRFRTRGS